jgi:hypothetical protein
MLHGELIPKVGYLGAPCQGVTWVDESGFRQKAKGWVCKRRGRRELSAVGVTFIAQRVTQKKGCYHEEILKHFAEGRERADGIGIGGKNHRPARL